MSGTEAAAAGRKVRDKGEVTLRWNGVSYVPDRLIDRHVLDFCGEHTKRYKPAQMDALLTRLSKFDLGYEVLGEE